MKIIIAILLLTIGAFAQNFICTGSQPDFKVELRYMSTYKPEFISYVHNNLWAHWRMNKTSMKQVTNTFVWYNGSETVVSYNYNTKSLRLIDVGEYVQVTELNCVED